VEARGADEDGASGEVCDGLQSLPWQPPPVAVGLDGTVGTDVGMSYDSMFLYTEGSGVGLPCSIVVASSSSKTWVGSAVSVIEAPPTAGVGPGVVVVSHPRHSHTANVASKCVLPRSAFGPAQKSTLVPSTNSIHGTSCVGLACM
jgi:hypothetical protein